MGWLHHQQLSVVTTLSQMGWLHHQQLSVVTTISQWGDYITNSSGGWLQSASGVTTSPTVQCGDYNQPDGVTTSPTVQCGDYNQPDGVTTSPTVQCGDYNQLDGVTSSTTVLSLYLKLPNKMLGHFWRPTEYIHSGAPCPASVFASDAFSNLWERKSPTSSHL